MTGTALLPVVALLALGVLPWLGVERENRERVFLAVAAFVLAFAVWSGFAGHAPGDATTVDGPSALVLGVIGLVVFAARLYALAYPGPEDEGRTMPTLFALFIGATAFTAMTRDLGLIWVGLEGTTLLSALLVAARGTGLSIEAAWKYVLLCSTGVLLGLLGVVVIFRASTAIPGYPHGTLDVEVLIAHAKDLDPALVRLGTVLLVFGFGSKAGLAPLHSWIPDAYGEAPTAVSATLSSALAKTTLLSVYRVAAVSRAALGPAFVGDLLVTLGVLSMLLAGVLILTQRKMKRLLAYSSLEHLGAISIGIGIGTPLGLGGALAHMVNHGATKALAFLAAGRVADELGTGRLDRIAGAGERLPLAGGTFLATAFALGGLPPFAIFFSELAIARAAFGAGRDVTGALYLLALGLVFAALVARVAPVVLGPAEEGERRAPVREPRAVVAAFACLLVPVLGGGLALPGYAGFIQRIAEGGP